jgi:hypothetical protein
MVVGGRQVKAANREETPSLRSCAREPPHKIAVCGARMQYDCILAPQTAIFPPMLACYG